MMSRLKYSLLRAGFHTLHGVRGHQAAGAWARGLGVILTLHHVRPWEQRLFTPSDVLEVTPEYLDDALGRLRDSGYDIVPLSDVPELLAHPRRSGRFVALTFDDGYRDNRDHALPVLRRHKAPFTVFITQGFAERTTGMWWRDLETILAREEHLRCRFLGGTIDLPLVHVEQKRKAYAMLYWRLRRLDEPDSREVMDELKSKYPVDSAADLGRMCMDWDELRALSADPLVTLGAHTLTHPNLAGCTEEQARREMAEGRKVIEAQIGRPVLDIAYPFGNAASAGPREFALARDLGFRVGVTTRPGVLYAEHGRHLLALPRISLNGRFQRLAYLDVMVSGLPFTFLNYGRRINVA